MNDNYQLSTSTQNLQQGFNLAEEELISCIQEIISESTPLNTKQDFLKALSIKGESDLELATFVREFRKMAVDPGLQDFAPHAIDLCGTGGDKAHSFNISTFVSFMVASAGFPVIKHGNRSISSKCGSADLIEGVGVPISSKLETIRESMEQLNFCFLFAPNFHPAFKHIAPVRKALAKENVITVFNLLGPTINPAKPENQLLGVFDPVHLQKIGNALTTNNVKSGLVVHGLLNNSNIQGVDELTNCGINKVFGVGGLAMEKPEDWSPEKWNTEKGDFSDLSGGDLKQNLMIMKSLIDGCAPVSLHRTILINASTAFWILGKCSSLEEGMEFAESLLVDGVVAKWLNKVRDFFK